MWKPNIWFGACRIAHVDGIVVTLRGAAHHKSPRAGKSACLVRVTALRLMRAQAFRTVGFLTKLPFAMRMPSIEA